MSDDDRRLEGLLRSLLRDVPPLPDGVLAATIATVPSISQQGSHRALPRWPRTSTYGQTLAFIGVLILIAALAAAVLVAGQQPSGPRAFAPGSLAFVKDGSLQVTGPEGVGVVAFPVAKQVYRLAFAPDGQHLALVDEDGVRIISPAGGVAGIHPLFGADTWGWADWADGGSELVVASEDQEHLVFLGLDGQEVRRIPLPTGFSWGWLPDIGSVSPEGRSIALFGCIAPCDIKFDPHILIVAADGSGWRWVTTETDMTGYSTRETWSPDGRLTLANSRDRTVEILSSEGATLLTIPDVGVTGAMAWSPDGSMLAFGSQYLWIADPEGSVRDVPLMWPDPVTQAPGWRDRSIGDIAWSGDGHSILFTVGGDTGPERLYAVDPSGGTPRLLVDGLGSADLDVAAGR